MYGVTFEYTYQMELFLNKDYYQEIQVILNVNEFHVLFLTYDVY